MPLILLSLLYLTNLLHMYGYFHNRLDYTFNFKIILGTWNLLLLNKH